MTLLLCNLYTSMLTLCTVDRLENVRVFILHAHAKNRKWIDDAVKCSIHRYMYVETYTAVKATMQHGYTVAVVFLLEYTDMPRKLTWITVLYQNIIGVLFASIYAHQNVHTSIDMQVTSCSTISLCSFPQLSTMKRHYDGRRGSWPVVSLSNNAWWIIVKSFCQQAWWVNSFR